VPVAAGKYVQSYETNRVPGAATSEVGTVKTVMPKSMEVFYTGGSDPKAPMRRMGITEQ
jgi:hypothetical protein